jgi:hypothetical protein
LIDRTPSCIALVSCGIAVLLMLPPRAIAQTCSCASVPILGSMELASPKDQQWYLATTYEYHDISDLVSGSDSITDVTGRDRTSEALIFEASRGLSEKWSISALLAAVSHEREVNNIRASASGLGDAIVMAKYSPQTISLYSDTTWSFGFGGRIPVGSNDETQNGITLAEDMQPSVGAYGGVLWGYWAHALNDSKSARIYASVSYTQNGENDRDYQFGAEATATLGGNYQTQSPWGFGVDLVYRTAERDQRASTDIPNTGGEWLDIIPSAQYHLTETLAIRASGKFPLARNLNDALQFTTKYSFRLSLSYVFGAEAG